MLVRQQTPEERLISSTNSAILFVHVPGFCMHVHICGHHKQETRRVKIIFCRCLVARLQVWTLSGSKVKKEHPNGVIEKVLDYKHTHTHMQIQITEFDTLKTRLNTRQVNPFVGQTGYRSAGTLSHCHAGTALERSTGGVA